MNKTNNELLNLMFSTSKFIRDRIKSLGLKHQLSSIHLWTLKFMYEKGDLSMSEITAFLNISAPSTTSFVDGLIKGGLVERLFDENDRRIIKIRLTAKGKEVYKSIINDICSRISDALGNLSNDERQALEMGMTALVKHLNFND